MSQIDMQVYSRLSHKVLVQQRSGLLFNIYFVLLQKLSVLQLFVLYFPVKSTWHATVNPGKMSTVLPLSSISPVHLSEPM